MKEKTFEFPDGWEEVTPEEWKYLLYLCHVASIQYMTLEDIKRSWCNRVVIMREKGVRKGESYLLLIDQLANTLDWMFARHENPLLIDLTYTSTVNLLPEWMGLVGPMDHGADLTFGEFHHAVTAFNAYTRDHDPEDLISLVAILYRTTIKRGHRKVRRPFNPDEIDENRSRVRDKMPEWIQWGVYAWFASFCQYLYTGVFLIEGNEVSFAPIFSRQSGQTDTGGYNLGMNSIRFTVADSGVFGTADRVDETPLLQVMLKLLDDKQRADEMTKNIKTK